MAREHKPTLTPTVELGTEESDALSFFLQIADEDPAVMVAALEPFTTCSAITAEATQPPSSDEVSAEVRTIRAVATLIDREVDFFLTPDETTQAAIDIRINQGDVSRIAKIKGYVGELAAFHAGQFSDELRLIAEHGAGSRQGDAGLFIIETPPPEIGAA